MPDLLVRSGTDARHLKCRKRLSAFCATTLICAIPERACASSLPDIQRLICGRSWPAKYWRLWPAILLREDRHMKWKPIEVEAKRWKPRTLVRGKRLAQPTGFSPGGKR